MRDEWESEIPTWAFDQLWPATAGKRVEKTRSSIRDGVLWLELDHYHGALQGLVTLEVEFPDEKRASLFKLPEWAKEAVEMTLDKAYKNKNLAVNGLPK